MARQIKISNGDLFAKGKTKAVCVTDAYCDRINYVIVKGQGKGDYINDSRSLFLKKYPARVDRIVIQ